MNEKKGYCKNNSNGNGSSYDPYSLRRGNADQSTNAPAGGSAQTTTDNGGSGEITKTDIVMAMGADVVTLDPA